MTYSELLAKVAAWLNRTDLTGVIPDFVELAEERINRHLRVRAMEVNLAATPIVDNEITLASDVLDVKTLWVPGYEGTPLKPQTLETVIANGVEGIPAIFAHKAGNVLRFDGSGSVQGVLYQRIPVLARALVLAGDTLLLAGPPDFFSTDEPAAALKGRKGGMLYVLSTAQGRKQAEYILESPPVLDGMAAAGGRLYMAAMNGDVVCFQASQ